MDSYRVDIEFYSPCVYYEPPTLDAAVSWCLAREHNMRRGFFQMPMATPEKNRGLNLLNKVVEHKVGGYGVPVSSWMIPAHDPLEFLDAWKKRFENKYVDLADFGRGRRRVNTSSGKYRSHNFPLPAKAVQACWFFVRGDGEWIQRLLENHLVGLGKKVSEGFGWISNLAISPVDLGWREILALRPVPVRLAPALAIETAGRKTKLCAWKPPYWMRRNTELCLVPEVGA